MELLTCKGCGQAMVGSLGDNECSDCAYPAMKEARLAAAKAVEEKHFEKSGVRLSIGEIFRRQINEIQKP